MEIIRTAKEIRARLDAERAQGRTIGMVGTSGAMHDGHLSLIRKATAENDVSLLFWGGAPADLGWKTASMSYARDPARDFPLAESAGARILYAPTAQELYPRRPMTRVSLPAMSSEVPHLEDPAHLDLIAYTMCKLWNMVGPCRNYFGEKDWQQLVMFQRLASDLFYPVEVLGSPTIREADGLALSSRNSQLMPEDRAKAPVLYGALGAARDRARDGSARTAAELGRIFADAVGDSARICYFVAVESDTMRPVDELDVPVRLLASVQFGATRLLDNLGLQPISRVGASR